MTDEKSVGATLREQREFVGLTQSELAERSGVSKRTIHKLEHDECDPRVGTVRAVCQALDLSILDVYEWSVDEG